MQIRIACPRCTKPTVVYPHQANGPAVCQKCGQDFTVPALPVPVCQVNAVPGESGRATNVSVSQFSANQEYVKQALGIAYLHYRKKTRAANAYDGEDEIEQFTRDTLEDLYAGLTKFDFHGYDL